MSLRLVKPSSYSQFTVVHGVNFLIYLFALGCFEFLLRAATADRTRVGDHNNADSRLPKWAVFAIGYAVFFWSSLSLITIERVSPDLLMAGFVYLATGLLLQIRTRPQGFSAFALLGAVLGFGYLAKAPVFPLAFVFFAISWILVGGWRKATPRVLTAVLIFLMVSAPWFVWLSKVKGRFTFGDSAKLNYLIMVNGVSPSWYFQNLGTAGGHFTHPVRKILDDPPIYEFATPLKGTIPVWSDPSYWSEGAVPRIVVKKQLSLVHRWLALYLDVLFAAQAGLAVGFVVLVVMAGRGRFREQIFSQWPVWLIGLVGLGMYSLVLAEPRYIAVFFCLLWAGLFTGLVMPSGNQGRSLVAIVTIAVVLTIAAPTAVSVVGHLSQVRKGQSHNEWQVAQDLREMGVHPHDPVARIGGLFGVGWARLLPVTVVAEVPRANARDYWCGSPDTQAEVIQAFRRLGVTAIIAQETPPDVVFVPGQEWKKLGDGTYYELLLSPGNAQ